MSKEENQAKILDMLRANPGSSGAEIQKQTRLAAYNLYPILSDLEQSKTIRSEWETEDPLPHGRPRRRLYTIIA